MKYRKFTIIFSTLLACTIIIFLFNPFSQSSEEKDYFAIIDLDVNDLNKKDMDIFIEESEYFNLLTSIQMKNVNNNDGIEFFVQIDNPSTLLKDVKITVHLNEKLKNIFHTDQLFISNNPHYTTLEPNGESKGLSVAKLFFPLPEDQLLDVDFSKNEIYDLLTDIKIKVSWTDKLGEEIIQYIKPEQSRIEIDSKAIDLLANF